MAKKQPSTDFEFLGADIPDSSGFESNEESAPTPETTPEVFVEEVDANGVVEVKPIFDANIVRRFKR